MKKLASFALFVIVLSLVLFGVFSHSSQSGEPNFSIKKINGKYQQVLKKAKEADTIDALNLYIDKIEALQTNAKNCIKEANDEITQLSDVIKSSKAAQEPSTTQADVSYLDKKQAEQKKRLSECRLFLYESQETLVSLKQKEQELSKNQLLKRSDSIVTLIKQVGIANDHSRLKQLPFVKNIKNLSGIQIATLLLLIGLSIIFSIFLKIFLKKYTGSKSSIELNRLTAAVLSFQYGAVLSLMLSFYIFIGKYSLDNFFDFEKLPYVFLVFFGLAGLAKYLFYPHKEIVGVLELKGRSGRILYILSMSVLILGAAGYVIAYLDLLKLFLVRTDELFRIIFVFFLTTALFSFCGYLIYTLHKDRKYFVSPLVFYFSILMVSILYFIMLALEAAGFHALVVYLLKSGFFTLVYYALAKIIWLLSNTASDFINHSRHIVTFKIKHFLGVKYINKIPEVTIIHWVINLLALFGFLSLSLYAWEVSENFIDVFIASFVTGFKVLNMNIVPVKLLLALLVFSLVLLLGRAISAHFAKRQNFQQDDDTQVAVATIVLYVFFAGAVLCALLVLNIDFTGIAIVAGALSVGIGLGLQNIVNNFISGLILLIEKPIKPGDRIVIGETEGFVKKVRIRSTQISTMLKEDVIVPNANLITEPVTNYMFRDQTWRISCPVGVAYGSDVELVKSVLMEVALLHPDVVKEDPNAPIVLFRQFADSSLNFELWCVINDVNKKYMVVSDLLSAIDAAFKANNITIAFPQRDIHIKTDLTQVTTS